MTRSTKSTVPEAPHATSVRVGQRWVANDPRAEQRPFVIKEVADGYALVAKVSKAHHNARDQTEVTRRVRIAVTRLLHGQRRQTGYRLVEDVT